MVQQCCNNGAKTKFLVINKPGRLSPTGYRVFTTILRSLTQILSWCASPALKDFSGMLCETD